MKNLLSEVVYKTSRSSGPGGQNVNKVETSVTAFWNVLNSTFFNDEEKRLIIVNLKNRINKDGYLIINSTEARSQLENKKIVQNKLLAIIEKSIYVPKERISTKPSRAKIQKRLDDKKRLSDKKERRKFRF